MKNELNAKQLSGAVKEGFERMKRYRKSRAMFIKDYVGHYARAEHGMTGDMPINLVFLAIHALVPTLIQKEGMNKIVTEFLGQKDYAEILGLAADRLQRKMGLKDIMRAGTVDMCFGFCVFKTSIEASGLLLPVGPDENIDPGMIYTDLVDLDDYAPDPTCVALDKADFHAHRVRVSRSQLERAGWDNNLIDALPSASQHPHELAWARSITQDSKDATSMYTIQDYVYVVEVYVPEAGAVVYIPDPYQADFEDFLRVNEYYGPPSGPLSFGALTQPVPGNPFPIAPVGVWRDLNEMANEIFKKFMGQSERQKDILLYQPQLADVADALNTAMDGAAIACSDPRGIQVASFGGQNPNNERMVQELRNWFNYMAGNPDQLMGIGTGADTATEYQGNQQNASVRIQDMRDMIADSQAKLTAKHVWFLHTDPLLFDGSKEGIPLIRRSTGDEDVQVILTPEQRVGDYLDFTFEIVKRSMTVLEPNLRSKRLLDFNTNIVPALTQAAMVMMQMGVQYNLPRALMQAAEEMGIADAVQETFQDPTFEQRMQFIESMAPKDSGKGSLAGILQNGGSPGLSVPSGAKETRMNQQAGGAIAQSAMGFGGRQW